MAYGIAPVVGPDRRLRRRSRGGMALRGWSRKGLGHPTIWPALARDGVVNLPCGAAVPRAPAADSAPALAVRFPARQTTNAARRCERRNPRRMGAATDRMRSTHHG